MSLPPAAQPASFRYCNAQCQFQIVSHMNLHLHLNLEEGDLRNLSGFSISSFADDDCGGVSLDKVENGGAVLEHRQTLPPLLLDADVTVSRRRRGMVRARQEENTAFFNVHHAALRPLRPWLPELRHLCCLFNCSSPPSTHDDPRLFQNSPLGSTYSTAQFHLAQNQTHY